MSFEIKYHCCCCCVSSVVSDSARPHRWKPTRLCRPWDTPVKNTGVGCHFLLQCMKVKSESEVAQLCPTFSDPMDCSPPGSSVHGFSRQEYWSGVPSPSPKIPLTGALFLLSGKADALLRFPQVPRVVVFPGFLLSLSLFDFRVTRPIFPRLPPELSLQGSEG